MNIQNPNCLSGITGIGEHPHIFSVYVSKRVNDGRKRGHFRVFIGKSNKNGVVNGKRQDCRACTLVQWQAKRDTAFEGVLSSGLDISLDSKAVSQPPHSRTLRQFGQIIEKRITGAPYIMLFCFKKAGN